MENFRGRVVVVTGAASGIGRGIATAFATEGARLAIADVDVRGLALLATDLRADGVTVIQVPTDVSDGRAVEALADATLAEFGSIDVVCNNAGVSTLGYAWETSEEDWAWVLNVNLWGVIHGIRTFIPHLLAQETGGHLVNTASLAGLTGAPLCIPYLATKHAIVGISKGLRAELLAQGGAVKVSVLCPGMVATNIVRAMRVQGHDAQGGNARPDVAGALELTEAGIDAGLAPELVGRAVVDAVRAERFWILPSGLQTNEAAFSAETDEILTAHRSSTGAG